MNFYIFQPFQGLFRSGPKWINLPSLLARYLSCQARLHAAFSTDFKPKLPHFSVVFTSWSRSWVERQCRMDSVGEYQAATNVFVSLWERTTKLGIAIFRAKPVVDSWCLIRCSLGVFVCFHPAKSCYQWRNAFNIGEVENESLGFWTVIHLTHD